MSIQHSISIFRNFVIIQIKNITHFYKYKNDELIEVGKAKILNQIPEILDCDLIDIKEKVTKNFLERKIIFFKPKIQRKIYENHRKIFYKFSHYRYPPWFFRQSQ